MAKPRARLVISVTYLPRAECMTRGCGTTWRPGRETTALAKAHAIEQDHVVHVYRDQVSEYARAE